MVKVRISTNAPASKVLTLFGVLVALCVSDNVGPRLLPLPSPSPELASTQRLPAQGQTASPAPPKGKAAGVRVEMVSAPRGGGGAGNRHQHEAEYAPKFKLTVSPARPLPARIDRRLHAGTSVPLSRPAGRAPPLV